MPTTHSPLAERKRALFQADICAKDLEVLNQLGFRSRSEFLSHALCLFKRAAELAQDGFRLASVTPAGEIRELLMP